MHARRADCYRTWLPPVAGGWTTRPGWCNRTRDDILRAMDGMQFTLELSNLLRIEVPGLSPEEKGRLVRTHLALWETDQAALEYRVSFVPFVPGRRPRDEVLCPGL